MSRELGRQNSDTGRGQPETAGASFLPQSTNCCTPRLQRQKTYISSLALEWTPNEHTPGFTAAHVVRVQLSVLTSADALEPRNGATSLKCSFERFAFLPRMVTGLSLGSERDTELQYTISAIFSH